MIPMRRWILKLLLLLLPSACSLRTPNGGFGREHLASILDWFVAAIVFDSCFSTVPRSLYQLGASVCLLLILQLVVGVSLFIAATICETIVWKASSPTAVNTGRSPEFKGAIVALFHMLFTWNNKSRALKEAFWRERLPDIMNLFATIVVFAVVIYLQGFRLEIHVKSSRFCGQCESALTSNIYILSQMLFNRFPDNFLIRTLGVREQMVKAGIAYYMSPTTPPHTLKTTFLDPIHTAIYVTFILTACAIFSKTWIGVSGSGAVRPPLILDDTPKAGGRTRVSDNMNPNPLAVPLATTTTTALPPPTSPPMTAIDDTVDRCALVRLKTGCGYLACIPVVVRAPVGHKLLICPSVGNSCDSCLKPRNLCNVCADHYEKLQTNAMRARRIASAAVERPAIDIEALRQLARRAAVRSAITRVVLLRIIILSRTAHDSTGHVSISISTMF
ncbi:unnamed protein product [Rhizoctonia solani]|uniref:Uncharacterized protein n=1 Tax=Rhizoctonia solani TaxID=456999 RepID=A0A8H3DQ13_9AGAM|nr:unnamed protein product [Rhizoctonia solani]CAE6531224.1 unnamed protein product [Rhizoctonia solani]